MENRDINAYYVVKGFNDSIPGNYRDSNRVWEDGEVQMTVVKYFDLNKQRLIK